MTSFAAAFGVLSLFAVIFAAARIMHELGAGEAGKALMGVALVGFLLAIAGALLV